MDLRHTKGTHQVFITDGSLIQKLECTSGVLLTLASSQNNVSTEGPDPTVAIIPNQAPLNESESDNTSFLNDGGVVMSSSVSSYMGDELLKSSSDGDDASLIDFLQRPFPYVSGYLSATDNATTFSNYRPLADLAQTEPYLSKLKGRFAVKAGLKIRLVVNAQKFQSGRYIVAWLPSGGAYGNGHDSYMRMHRHCLTQITQLPHVELDISTQTEAVLEIPYVSFTTAMGIGSAFVQGDPGWVFIYPYVPLHTVVGGAAASFTLWFQMTNVSLSSIAVPQMGRRGTPSQREQEASKLGAYSSITDKVARTARHLGNIPLLSTFTTPAQFVADTLTGALQIWGLSKPPNFKPVERIENVPFSMGASANVSDPTQPLSLDVNNTMSLIPSVGGTDEDEMSLAYLKSIYSYFARVDWDASYASNSLLTSFLVSPCDMYQTTTDSGQTLRSHTPVSFLATLFTQWKGGLKYRLKFVKTQFHSGRLLIAFTPYNHYDRTTPPTTSVALSAYSHREIVDVRDITEYEFVVPYVALTPWLRCNGRPSAMGLVSIFVLDSLVYPATVPSTVPILFEVAGAEDLSFAVPTSEDAWSIMRPATLQSNIPMLGGSNLSSDPLRDASSCIGETVLSLRQLVKRPSFFTEFDQEHANFVLYPYVHEVVTGDGTLIGKPYVGGTNMLTLITSLYALSRGGVSYRMFTPAPYALDAESLYPTQNLVSVTIQEPWVTYLAGVPSEIYTTEVSFAYYTTPSSSTNAAINESRRRPILTFVEALSGGIQFTVPQYFTSHSRPTSSALVTPTFSALDKRAGTFPSWRVLLTKSDKIDKLIIENYGADDYSCHRFVSIPPLIARTATNPT